jgi:group II intron reverse transcriptase/maturase
MHAKAKQSPLFRFYILYDKLYRADVLRHAYALCKANKGESGVDGQDFAAVEACGLERWLGDLTQRLKEETYRPQAVRRVYIPKPDGSQRPLGIPTITDRVVQTAAVLVLSPIYEADLPEEQYAYRQGHGALDAVRQVHGLLCRGYTQVVDADLSGYFDSIPHAELMKSLARRIVDAKMLHLIKMWLEMAVEESDRRGHTRRTTRNRDQRRGTPQGAPISPLLSNLYMRRFVLGWRTLGHQKRLDARIVNYADDFVICCRGTADQAMAAMREMMCRLKLMVNESKTRVCRLPHGKAEPPGETFDFLGYTFGRCYRRTDGSAYLGTRPSQKRIARLCAAIHEATRSKWSFRDAAELVGHLNVMLRGWANYFCLGPVSRAYRAIDAHARKRVRQWLKAKRGRQSVGWRVFSDGYLHDGLGLMRLSALTKSYAWAKV